MAGERGFFRRSEGEEGSEEVASSAVAPEPIAGAGTEQGESPAAREALQGDMTPHSAREDLAREARSDGAILEPGPPAGGATDGTPPVGAEAGEQPVSGTPEAAADRMTQTPGSSAVAAQAGAVAPAATRIADEIDAAEADAIFRRAIALFNAVRYWHAHEEWERLWHAADEKDRDFYQGLIQVAAGFLHLQRRNRRGAYNKLSEGLEKLGRYQPRYRGIVVDELTVRARQVLDELEAGAIPYLAPPPVIKSS